MASCAQTPTKLQFFEKLLASNRAQSVDPPPALMIGLEAFDRILQVFDLSRARPDVVPCTLSHCSVAWTKSHTATGLDLQDLAWAHSCRLSCFVHADITL